ncbi:MAG: nuclear transport factor 2 family protein [Cytophagales bacterium]|nr:nuclear transport factor 2 family protein [Cytophagales bacterium]
MRLFLLLFFVGLYTVCPGQKLASEIDKLHRQKFTWLINKNYDSLNRLLHEQVQYVHSNGWVQSKAEVIDDLKSEKLNYTRIEVVESTVNIYKGTAIVSGKGHFRGLMPDKSEFKLSLFYTEVYVKAGKEWKLINRLATKVTL